MGVGWRRDRGWRRAAFALLILAPIMAAAPVLAEGVHILAVRLGGTAAGTRIVLDLDGPGAAPLLTRQGEGAFELDVRSAADDGLQGAAGRGLVKAWSAAPSARGERLRFDLAPGAVVSHRFMMPPSSDVAFWRYVVDLAPTPTPTPTPPPTTPPPTTLPLSAAVTPMAEAVAIAPYVPPLRPESVYASPVYAGPVYAEPARVARTAVAAPASRPLSVTRSRTDHRLKVVVVDAGHGGHDSGALGVTRQEKELTLAAAQTLKSRLERFGRYRVLLTRDSDVFIPLETRVRIARDGGADLFISLHADSAGGDASTHGASVYTLSDSGGGRVHYVLGRDEWFAKASSRGDPATSQILLDLTQRSTRNRSAIFADLLLDRLAGRVDLLPRSHRDAGYFVLLAPDVPAALLEMGFITNPEDETRLADPAQRGRMMDAVADAIDAYFAEGRAVAAE